MSGLTNFLMHEVEMRLVEVVAAMEDAGYPVDVNFFRELRGRLEPEIATLRDGIRRTAAEMGMPNFNPNSPKQLCELLYERLGLQVLKRTKADNSSTDAEALAPLQSAHGVIPQLSRYRDLHKIISTYCTIPDQVDEDRRLRVEFNQLDAETGRLNSPSIMQTVPNGDEFGIRRGFRAGDGDEIVGADYKQQELRVLAQVSGDRNMQAAITNGTDLHGVAAVKVFQLDCGPNEVEERHPDKRDQIKSIQFGLIYGRGAHNLASALKISREAADQLIEDYFQQFPAVRGFIREVHARVVHDGHVEDLFGRRRYFPDAKLKVARKRYDRMPEAEKKVVSRVSAAKRAAQNFVVQGASATITKLAMIRCHRHTTAKYGEAVQMILTLHDELHSETCKSAVAEFASELPGLMCDLDLERFGFEVPMAVAVHVGPSWGELTMWKGSQDGGDNGTGQG